MNISPQNQYLSLDEGIRNITDNLLANFCCIHQKETKSSVENKIREFKKLIRESFYEYIKKNEKYAKKLRKNRF